MSHPDDSLHGRIDDHFDEMTGLLYLEGQLDPGRARDVSAHVAACGLCRELLGALEKEAVWLREALVTDEESLPARLVAKPERGSLGWGWVVAFGLGVGGAYTLWTGFIQPSLTQAAQAGFTQGNVLTMLFFTGAFWKGWDTMRTLPEFMAAATLGMVAIWLLRRHWQRFTTIAFVMGALACALALSPSAGAAQMERGDPSYTLPAGQVVKNDLIVVAGQSAHRWRCRRRLDFVFEQPDRERPRQRRHHRFRPGNHREWSGRWQRARVVPVALFEFDGRQERDDLGRAGDH